MALVTSSDVAHETRLTSVVLGVRGAPFDEGTSLHALKILLTPIRSSKPLRGLCAAQKVQSAIPKTLQPLMSADFGDKKNELVGGTERVPQLSREELRKLKALLNAL